MYAYLALIFVGGAIGVYFGAKKVGYEPIQLFSRIFLVYIAIDLLLKYFMQQLPAENIKPFLTMKISKNQVAGYTLVKILVSFFSWAFLLFAIPFAALLIFKGNLNAVTVLLYFAACISMVFINTFVNTIINKSDKLMYSLSD